MRNQRGYSLLETGLVISTSIVLGAAVIALMNATSEGAKEKEALNQVQVLVQLARSQTGQGAAAQNGIQQAIIAAGQAPEGWLVRNGGTTDIRGSWGGTVTVDAIQLYATSAFADGIRINANGMPRALCSRLLMSTSQGVLQSAVGGTLFKAQDNSLAITSARAQTVCANSATQAVTFTYTAG